MSSNCFIVYDDETRRTVVIDPGSEKSYNEIAFINEHNLDLDNIILTHEHTDHNWGVNSLKEKFPNLKIVCSKWCDKLVKKSNRIFFSYYYDNPDYNYAMTSADVLIQSEADTLPWNGCKIYFVMTLGHSKASMCIDINSLLFTGDTIMPFPRYLNKKDGNADDWKKSVEFIINHFSKKTIIYPGHGDVLTLGEWIEQNNI